MPNKKIKVSEATVAKLRKGTMAGNLAKAKSASPEMREALMRFYGAKRVNAAIGKTGPGSVTKPKPFTPKPNDRENRKAPVIGTANDREGRKPAVVTPRGGPGAKMAKTKASSPVKPSSVKPMGRAQTKQATYDKALKSARAQAAADRKKMRMGK